MATNIVDTNGIIQGSSETLSTIHQNKGWGVNYISQNWIPGTGVINSFNGSILGNTTTTTGTLYFYPFFAKNNFIATEIATRVGNAAVGGSNFNLGVYRNLLNKPTGDPIPGTTSGSLSSATTNTNRSYTFITPIEMKAGTMYWLAITCSSSTPNFPSLSVSPLLTAPCLGSSTVSASNTNIVGWTQSFTYGTVLPTVGTLSERTAAPHLIFLRVQ